MFSPLISFRRFLAVTTAITMLAPVLPASAQDASGNTAPPSRVGEVASINGSVSYNGAGSNGQWVAATGNYPLASGDSLFTQASSEAAIAVDSSRINLAQNTELQLTGIDENNVAATESQGEIFLSVNYLQQGQSFVITTPRGTVTINQNGNYGINAGDANNPTVVTVLAGEATVTDPGATLQVQAGQSGVLSGTDQTTAQLGQAQRDPFMTEMLAEIAPPPPSYAPPVVQQMTGVSQLGNYGSWNQSTQYGAVWYPSVAPGWTPYREGHWAYVAPWGYTWVENEPWGFAPFHYGRWIDQDNRWGWAPAPAYSEGGYGGYGPSYQPVYAPAVVSFFGAGLAVGLTIGALNSRSVGWVPLGPDEPYYPNYRCPPDYIRRINVVNVRNINVVNIHNTTINNYNNYNYGTLANRRAATYIPADAMSRGEQVSRYGRPAPQTMLASARPVGPEGFRPQPGQPGQPNAAHGPIALPPPAYQHRPGVAPQPTAFGERHNLPPAVISQQPAVVQGGGFAPLHQPGAPHPGFQPPAPPAGEIHPGLTGQQPVLQHPSSNGGQPLAPPNQLAHPGLPAVQHPGFNAGQPNPPQHPGFATMPGYHAPPPPPNGMVHPGQALPGQPVGQQQFHPQAPQHAPMPQVITPQQQFRPQATPQPQQFHPQPVPQQQFHPQPMPQVIRPQQPAQQYHPQPMPQQQQQFHPQPVPQPMPQVIRPQQPAQQFHPQPMPQPQQFHPQPAQQPMPQQQFHPQPAQQPMPQQQFHPQPQPQEPHMGHIAN